MPIYKKEGYKDMRDRITDIVYVVLQYNPKTRYLTHVGTSDNLQEAQQIKKTMKDMENQQLYIWSVCSIIKGRLFASY